MADLTSNKSHRVSEILILDNIRGHSWQRECDIEKDTEKEKKRNKQDALYLKHYIQNTLFATHTSWSKHGPVRSNVVHAATLCRWVN